ncbi:MAG: hypothetical protein ACK559_20250, partial [bacterium]
MGVDVDVLALPVVVPRRDVQQHELVGGALVGHHLDPPQQPVAVGEDAGGEDAADPGARDEGAGARGHVGQRDGGGHDVGGGVGGDGVAAQVGVHVARQGEAAQQ